MIVRRKGCLPVEPFRRVLEEWIAEHEEIPEGPNGDGALGHIMIVANRIDRRNPARGMRMLYRVRNEATYLTYEVADRIVCGTYGPQHWQADPELRAIHEQLPRGVDEEEELLSDEEIREWAAGVVAGWDEAARRAMLEVSEVRAA